MDPFMQGGDTMRGRHVIQFYPAGGERMSWECSCGSAGSAPEFTVEEAAEKHIPDGQGATYRHPARSWHW